MSDTPVPDAAPAELSEEETPITDDQPLFDEQFQEPDPAGPAGNGKDSLPFQTSAQQPSAPLNPDSERLGMLMDVNLELAVELGHTRLTVREVLELQKGSVVELDRIAGEAVDVLINDHLMARGEVVVVDDRFGVRITEIITPSNNKGED